MNESSTDYRRLLATVDLGETMEPVVARAVDLGRRCEAGVDLANVLEGMPVFLYHAASADELKGILDKSTRWSHERLEEIKARHPEVGAIHTASGLLAEEIQELAVRAGADLLVIGAHDRRGVAVFYRDRSDEILHRASCDVLVVKRDGSPYRQILAALDLDVAGLRALRRAVRVAALFEASLTLVHVIDHFPVDRSNALIAPEDKDPLEFSREEAVRALCRQAEEAGAGDCAREVIISSSTASREIPAFAAANGIDLIVTGSHGRHGLGRLLGSTADGIVHRASCDVLVVRQPMRAA